MNNATFSEMTKRIEEIAVLLEKGETSLEDSLKLFSEASELIAKCNLLLKNAKLKITDIGSIVSEDNDE